MSKRSRVILITLILVISAFFRLWQLSGAPPAFAPFEAEEGLRAQSILETGAVPFYYPESGGHFGILTLLNIPGVTQFGNTAFAARIASSLLGILVVLVLYFFTREYLRNDHEALVASFLAGTSLWYFFFSRIGTLAMSAPFFLLSSLWLLYSARNGIEDKKKHSVLLIQSIVGGILFGLGFYTGGIYLVSVVVLIPVLYSFVRTARANTNQCILCIPALFVFAALVTTSPFILFVSDHQNAAGTITPLVSTWSEFVVNMKSTIGMFFKLGDRQWHHNWPGEPALFWPTALFFLVGIFVAIKRKRGLFLLWLVIMIIGSSAVSAIHPNAEISILAAPAAFILSAMGIISLWRAATRWLKKQESRFPEFAELISRIRGESFLLVCIILIAIAAQAYITYFLRWANNPFTKRAFGENAYTIGRYLNEAEDTIPKYVITRKVETVDRAHPPSFLQPILFATATAPPLPEGAHNIWYLGASDFKTIDCKDDCIVIIVDTIQPTMLELKKIYPTLQLEPVEKLGILAARPKK